MGTKYKRSRLWVDPGFQFRLQLRMGLYLLLYIGLVLFIDFAFELMADFGNNITNTGHNGRRIDFFGRQKYLLFALLVSLPIILYDLLKFSHRVAGPLYRCRKMMQQMAGGEVVPEFKPRKHDLMSEFFQAFNGLIKEWNRRVNARVNGRLGEANPAVVVTGEIGPPPENGAVAVS
jgi:hypothetical protein